jgi:hypothetical protein
MPERSTPRIGSSWFSRPRGADIQAGAVLQARRWAAVVAVMFGVVTLGIGLASVPIDGFLHQTGPGGPVADWLVTAVPMVSAAAVGTLVAARRPGNPIGWMLLAIFLFAAAPTAGYSVLDYRVHHGTLPFGGTAVVLGEAWPMFLVLVAILLWLFPTGGCRRAAGGVRPGCWPSPGCWPGWWPRPGASWRSRGMTSGSARAET